MASDPAQTVLSPKSFFKFSSTALMIVVGFSALAAGLAGGYWYGAMGQTKVADTSNLKVVMATPDPNFNPASLSAKMIDGPIKDWGGLVQNAYAEFRVKGQVVEVKEEAMAKYGDKLGPGHYVILQSGGNQYEFFVGDATWRQGKEADFANWQAITPADVKAGDTVSLLTHAPLKEGSTTDSFYAWSVFKHE